MGLRLLTVALKFSDGVGDHNNIFVCQKTGGNFQFVENPCSIFMVATGEYPMDPYEFTIPNSGSKVRLLFLESLVDLFIPLENLTSLVFSSKT